MSLSSSKLTWNLAVRSETLSSLAICLFAFCVPQRKLLSGAHVVKRQNASWRLNNLQRKARLQKYALANFQEHFTPLQALSNRSMSHFLPPV
jgi:hypothetical protein